MNFLITLIKKAYTNLIKRKFAHFGKNSFVQPILNSTNEKHISIGNDCFVGNFCRLTVSTQFANIKVKSKNKIRLKIGNNVDIGSNSFISANNNIQIGNHIIMSTQVFITDHDHGVLHTDLNLHQQPLTENGYVIIKDNVFIGTKASILKNVTIGQHSSIGANSVVTKDVPAYSIVAGNPAKILKQYDLKLKKWLDK